MVPAVTVEGVSKRFRLYHEKYTSLKERVIHLGHVPFEEFWALKDVDIEIGQGESIGLLGHNGSGKSTLLKCIAGILQPTSGRITVRGKLAAMLELGAGFHPELSGRANIYLNASLLGMNRREVDRRFDEIVAFAELEQFIDNQIRFYSSGMQARLGFAVAVTFEPEVLLVDEVLAVGDENFQRKCLDRIRLFQTQGRTIIIVSHAPDLVRMICSRAFVLNRGQVVAGGPAGEAIRVFREYLRNAGEPLPEIPEEVPEAAGPGTEPSPRPRARGSNGKICLGQVVVEHPGLGARPYLLPDEPLTVRVGFDARTRVDDAVFSISIYDDRGELVYGCNTERLGQDVGPVSGSGQVVFSFESMHLLDGAYGITLGIEGREDSVVYDWSEQQHHFEVMNPGRATGAVSLPLTARLQADGALAPESTGAGADLDREPAGEPTGEPAGEPGREPAGEPANR